MSNLEYMELREQMCDVCHKMWQLGWVAANDGNVSVRLPDGNFMATPTGFSKSFITPEKLVIINKDGEVLSGAPYKPSSEIKMHLRCYSEREDVGAVVHAHLLEPLLCLYNPDVPYPTKNPPSGYLRYPKRADYENPSPSCLCRYAHNSYHKDTKIIAYIQDFPALILLIYNYLSNIYVIPRRAVQQGNKIPKIKLIPQLVTLENWLHKLVPLHITDVVKNYFVAIISQYLERFSIP